MKKDITEELAALTTEKRNRRSLDIDLLPTIEVLRVINNEDKLGPHAVERELPYIAQAVELVSRTLKDGGRLIYVGAGTSGRLGILDASECPPTFGTPPDLIQGVIAGGPQAVFRSQEGAEDREMQAERDIETLHVSPADVVCGIAASRRTPYVVAAIRRARTLGAKTIYITTNPRHEFNLDVDVAICPDVGPEVIMGSTRMKSGTAQKLVLNMITTASMIKLGKVYENMMVDLQLNSTKLVERAKRILVMATGMTHEDAERILNEAGGQVKTAIVMAKTGSSAAQAKDIVSRHAGFVRAAILSSLKQPRSASPASKPDK